jgi:hypothetical protein
MSEQKARHIGIAIPCMDQVDAWFAHDLARAVGHHAAVYPQDVISMSFHQSAFLAESRNEMCKTLLEQGADYILFLDSDMRFPQTLFNDLCAHELPVVAANCAKRRRPISATARRENEKGELEAVWPDENKREGLERIAIVGTAVMAIKADVFFQIEYPWFATPWHRDDQRFVGEDLYFCAQLKKFDVPMYIDHAVSWQVGHIGQYTFELKDVLAERELARQGAWSHIHPQQTQQMIEVVKA